MWSPTHVQVTVHQARNLKIKGKGGLNDSYVTIQLGREKYQTSIKERTRDPVWNEECDLSMSAQAKFVKLCVFHRNLLGLDEFLGEVLIPLKEIQVHARPPSRWYRLQGKPGCKKPEKDRGEVEATVTFLVQKTTTSQLSLNVDGTKTKKSMSFKNLTHAVGERLRFSSRSSLNKCDSKADLDSSGVYSSQNVSQKSLADDVLDGSCAPAPGDLQSEGVASSLSSSVHELYECGPVSSVMVSDNSPQVSRSATLGRMKTGRGSAVLPELWSQTCSRPAKGKGKSSTLSCATGHSVATKMATYELHEIEEYKRERQRHDLANNDVEFTHQLRTYEHEELVRLITEQRAQLKVKDTYIRDLEDYIDDLLLKVMETHPKLLQNPYVKRGGETGSTQTSANKNTSIEATAYGIPRSATLSPGVYVTNTRNKNISPTSPSLLTEIVTQGPKSSKSSRCSANGNPLKFIQSLITSK